MSSIIQDYNKPIQNKKKDDSPMETVDPIQQKEGNKLDNLPDNSSEQLNKSSEKSDNTNDKDSKTQSPEKKKLMGQNKILNRSYEEKREILQQIPVPLSLEVSDEVTYEENNDVQQKQKTSPSPLLTDVQTSHEMRTVLEATYGTEILDKEMGYDENVVGVIEEIVKKRRGEIGKEEYSCEIHHEIAKHLVRRETLFTRYKGKDDKIKGLEEGGEYEIIGIEYDKRQINIVMRKYDEGDDRFEILKKENGDIFDATYLAKDVYQYIRFGYNKLREKWLTKEKYEQLERKGAFVCIDVEHDELEIYPKEQQPNSNEKEDIEEQDYNHMEELSIGNEVEMNIIPETSEETIFEKDNKEETNEVDNEIVIEMIKQFLKKQEQDHMEDDTKSDETEMSAIQKTSEDSDIEYLLEKIKQFGKTLEQNHMEDATKSNETEMNPIQETSEETICENDNKEEMNNEELIEVIKQFEMISNPMEEFAKEYEKEWCDQRFLNECVNEKRGAIVYSEEELKIEEDESRKMSMLMSNMYSEYTGKGKPIIRIRKEEYVNMFEETRCFRDEKEREKSIKMKSYKLPLKDQVTRLNFQVKGLVKMRVKQNDLFPLNVYIQTGYEMFKNMMKRIEIDSGEQNEHFDFTYDKPTSYWVMIEMKDQVDKYQKPEIQIEFETTGGVEVILIDGYKRVDQIKKYPWTEVKKVKCSLCKCDIEENEEIECKDNIYFHESCYSYAKCCMCYFLDEGCLFEYHEPINAFLCGHCHPRPGTKVWEEVFEEGYQKEIDFDWETA